MRSLKNQNRNSMKAMNTEAFSGNSMKFPMENPRNGTTGDNTGNLMDYQTDNGTRNDMQYDIRNQTDNGTRNDMQYDIRNQTDNGTRNDMQYDIRNQTDNGMRNDMQYGIGNQTDNGMREDMQYDIRNQTDNGMQDAMQYDMGNQTDNGMQDAMQYDMGNQTDDGMREDMQYDMGNQTDNGMRDDMQSPMENLLGNGTEDSIGNDIEYGRRPLYNNDSVNQDRSGWNMSSENIRGWNRESDDVRGWRPVDPMRERMWIRGGIIEEVNQQMGIFYLLVFYRERGRRQSIRLVVSRETKIINENRREISARNLEVGMVIDALVSNAMTRSNPPQANAFQINVIRQPERRATTTGRVLQVNSREQFILVMSGNEFNNMIRFNVGPQTSILDLFGRPITLRGLLPGMRVRILHANAVTASIPPQTRAYEVRVIR